MEETQGFVGWWKDQTYDPSIKNVEMKEKEGASAVFKWFYNFSQTGGISQVLHQHFQICPFKDVPNVPLCSQMAQGHKIVDFLNQPQILL